MNGAQRRLATLLGAAFLAVNLVILVANAESTMSDLAAADVAFTPHLIWSWEWTSMIGWFSVMPVIWMMVLRVRPPRFGWPAIVAIFLVASLLASFWHIEVMIWLRKGYYAMFGLPYRFFGVVRDRILYEYRKDVATFLQFVIVSLMAQWLIARAAASETADLASRILLVVDGAITHRIPIDEIESVASAGNYVELRWLGRTLLHRATLAAVAGDLGEAFVRIHRGRLVRRGAVRSVETDRSGDFTAVLASGDRLRGSRRYRGLL